MPLPFCTDELCHIEADLDRIVGRDRFINSKRNEIGGLTVTQIAGSTDLDGPPFPKEDCKHGFLFAVGGIRPPEVVVRG